MKLRGLLLFAFLLLASMGRLAAQDSATNNIRFVAVDVFVDSGGTPLAAYQLEFAATNGAVKIVGIEGGEHTAFRNPPHYDPKAMQGERVVIAAFSTDNQLPNGKTRVATIHLQITGTETPKFTINLQAAGNSAGKRITASASFEEKKSP